MMGLKVLATDSNALTEYIMFFLQEGTAITTGSHIPIVRLTECRRVFVAVAVSAIIFNPADSILRTSPMRFNTARKDCPLQRIEYCDGFQTRYFRTPENKASIRLKISLPFFDVVCLINDKCFQTGVVYVTTENLPPSLTCDE